MARKYDLAVPVDRYTKDGQEKTKWLNIGAVIETQNGLAMKLESIPVEVIDKNGTKIPFNGWVNLFEVREQGRQTPAQKPQVSVPAPNDGFDDIPF